MKQHHKRQKIVKSLLKDLRKAGKLVDGLGDQVRLLDNDLDRSDFIRGMGKTLTEIAFLEFNLFDIEPTLTFDYLKPSLAPIEFDSALERLMSDDWAIRKSTIHGFKNNMLDQVASEFEVAWDSGTGYEFAQDWWERQPKPFVPVIHVYKKLKNGRRFDQYNCAKLLESEFGIRIWDDERDDVILEVADEWFSAWLASYSG